MVGDDDANDAPPTSATNQDDPQAGERFERAHTHLVHRVGADPSPSHGNGGLHARRRLHRQDLRLARVAIQESLPMKPESPMFAPPRDAI